MLCLSQHTQFMHAAHAPASVTPHEIAASAKPRHRNRLKIVAALHFSSLRADLHVSLLQSRCPTRAQATCIIPAQYPAGHEGAGAAARAGQRAAAPAVQARPAPLLPALCGAAAAALLRPAAGRAGLAPAAAGAHLLLAPPCLCPQGSFGDGRSPCSKCCGCFDAVSGVRIPLAAAQGFKRQQASQHVGTAGPPHTYGITDAWNHEHNELCGRSLEEGQVFSLHCGAMQTTRIWQGMPLPSHNWAALCLIHMWPTFPERSNNGGADNALGPVAAAARGGPAAARLCGGEHTPVAVSQLNPTKS